MGKAIDQTVRIRRFVLEKSDTSRCLGCGDKAPQGGFLGTSRWNAKANLCDGCCTREALGGTADPFGLSFHPGGRNFRVTA